MNTEKAIQTIDAIVSAGLSGRIDTNFIDQTIYGKFDRELYRHILNKWKNADGDYFGFYLSAADEVKRWMLEELGVEVEPDKYPDYDTRITAQLLAGKSRSEVYPFETDIVYSFFLFGYNHSLQALEKVSTSAWQTVQEESIDLYGDYKNWSEFWCKATYPDKELLLRYIIENSKG